MVGSCEQSAILLSLHVPRYEYEGSGQIIRRRKCANKVTKCTREVEFAEPTPHSFSCLKFLEDHITILNFFDLLPGQ